MSLIAIAETLQHNALVGALRNAPPVAVLLIQIAHVLGLILLLSSLLLVNLRLLGWGLRSLPLQQVVRATRKALWLGLGLTIGSGLLLFALAVQATLYRRVTASHGPSPLLARSTAVVSLTLWFSVGLAGRAIGFV